MRETAGTQIVGRAPDDFFNEKTTPDPLVRPILPPEAMNCDRVARIYRWLEYAAFGRVLERRRTAFLSELSQATRILALGDGDGRALAALVGAAPKARIDYVDVSAKMLELARASLSRGGRRESEGAIGRVSFQQADARQAQFNGAEYNAIVTHFFFDCFNQCDLPLVIANAAGSAHSRATWIVSEFRPASRGARILIALMYAFFGAATGLKTRRLVDHHPLLVRHGFRLQRAEHSWSGMIASELWFR